MEKIPPVRTWKSVLAVPAGLGSVDRAPSGAAVLVAQLARAHAPALARLFRYLGIPARDVEDALQDVFLTAHRRLAEAPDLAERPDAWLRGVAVNVARNRRRSVRRSPIAYVEDLPEVHDERTPEAAVVAERQRRRLLALLEALPEDHRMALVLFEIDGRPMKDVASILGCALPTAYKYVTLAQGRLKDALAREEGEAR